MTGLHPTEPVPTGTANGKYGARLCANVREPRMRRIVFLYCLLPRAATALLVFRLTKSRRTFYAQNERRIFAQPRSKAADVDDRPEPRYHLPLEPHIFNAPTVVLAVDHDGQPFELRLHASCRAGMIDDRPRAVLLQFLIDLPDEVLAPLLIGYRRLLDEQILEFRIAVAGIVAL